MDPHLGLGLGGLYRAELAVQLYTRGAVAGLCGSWL